MILIGLFVLFLLLSKSSLYILDTRILTDIWLQIFFQFRKFLCTFLTVFLEIQKFSVLSLINVSIVIIIAQVFWYHIYNPLPILRS